MTIASLDAASLDAASLIVVLLGALVAGFTTGLAGFGTGLVSAGFWFHALPAPMVPPLVALASVAGQSVGLITVRKAFDWKRVAPFLIGGLLGVPLGVGALRVVSPDILRLSVGGFLVAYAAYQLSGLFRLAIGSRGGRGAEARSALAAASLAGSRGYPARCR